MPTHQLVNVGVAVTCITAGLFVCLFVCSWFLSRTNLIRNMYSQYKRTGYIWEQYDDVTGAGKVRPYSVMGKVWWLLCGVLRV